MSEGMRAPVNRAAEWSVLAHMLLRPQIIGEVVGLPVEQSDFSQPDTRLLYATTVERYYGSDAVDALIVGELVRDDLAQLWGLADNADVAQQLVRKVRESDMGGSVLEHAHIVKRLSTSRKLQDACFHAIAAIGEGKLSPEEIGDSLSSEALQITAGSIRRTELNDWMTTGREYAQHLQRLIKARSEGVEIGVYTGMPFIDEWTTGIGPGELCFLAGEPGVGKTAVAWGAAMGFAARQLMKAPDKRVGTLMCSLEMNLFASTMRVVQALTGIDGTRLREGNVTKREFQHILREWKNREMFPMFFNFASNFRLSQLRALVAEAIRKANVGFVVIDHFRMIDPDRVIVNPNAEDEAKVRFLKEELAKDLNVAVLCLAHTIKVGRGMAGESPRPRLSDLRGSGQIAAHADFVGFLWNPGKYMSEEARVEMAVDPHDMELSWEKNRFGTPGSAKLHFQPEQMRVVPR